jgi:DNA-binding NarL/FixJ family response regulator
MRILVVDDHALVRDGLISLLESAGHYVVGDCGDGQSAVEQAIKLQPDVVLLDICMPKMDGVQTLKAIKTNAPNIKVVMLTISEDEEFVLQAIRSGADGYMIKSASGDEFLNCLRALEMGDLALSRSLATLVIQGLMLGQTEEEDSELTDREIEILQYVANGYSNKVIGKFLTVSENTIKYHLKKILQKLNARNRAEAVARAISLDLISREFV